MKNELKTPVPHYAGQGLFKITLRDAINLRQR